MVTIKNYRTLSSLANSTTLDNQRVFLRADLNVPIAAGTILDDYRLQAILPTLDLLLAHQATITIATHIGRPEGHEEALSTKHLVPWFAQRGYTITFAATLDEASTLSRSCAGQLVMVENLRFFPGEKARDEQFAQRLARLGDYYVTDSFATLYRDDTSITLVPYLFAPDHRYIGLLVEQELNQVSHVLHNPAHPFLLVIGGGKVTDKIPLIMHLLDIVDTVLLCPAIVFTFAAACGQKTGASVVDHASQKLCLELLEQARRKKVQIVFPTDYYVAYGTFDDTMQKEPVAANALQPDMVGITIGPDTMSRYADYIKTARTVVVNGLMGTVDRPETLRGSRAVFQALADNSTAVRLVGGGDTVAAAAALGFQGNIGHISTGGGALLALLSGQNLAGLTPYVYIKK